MKNYFTRYEKYFSLKTITHLVCIKRSLRVEANMNGDVGNAGRDYLVDNIDFEPYNEAWNKITEDTSKAVQAIGVTMKSVGELAKIVLKNVVQQFSKFKAEIIRFKNEAMEQKPVFIFGAVIGAAATFFVMHNATKKNESDRTIIKEEINDKEMNDLTL